MIVINRKKADRAKQIKTKAVVNEDPTEKLINDLKTENARLKKLLEDSKVDPNLAKAGGAAGGAAAGAAGGEGKKRYYFFSK